MWLKYKILFLLAFGQFFRCLKWLTLTHFLGQQAEMEGLCIWTPVYLTFDYVGPMASII